MFLVCEYVCFSSECEFCGVCECAPVAPFGPADQLDGMSRRTFTHTHARVLGTLSANAGQHLFGVAREQEVLGEVGQPIGVRLLERARIAARQGRRRRVGFLALAVTVGASVRFPFVARAGVFVRLHVCLQVAGKRERFVADFTNVRFITCEPERTRERER